MVGDVMARIRAANALRFNASQYVDRPETNEDHAVLLLSDLMDWAEGHGLSWGELSRKAKELRDKP